MLPTTEEELDRFALHHRLLKEIQDSESILVRLFSAEGTPTVLQARQLYTEQLTRLQTAVNKLSPL
jgi:hypothetical protein